MLALGTGARYRRPMTFATTMSVSLPPWLIEELASLPATLTAPEERMDLANELADRNWRAGHGGPFAAVVADRDSGELLSVGVNLVLGSGLSSMHAEVVAIALAQQRLGTWDLGADGHVRELVSSARPCVQCYGATMWSGVRSLVIGADGPDVEAAAGFDEGPLVDDWVEQFAARGIAVTTGVRRSRAVEVLSAFGAAETTVYNARGNGAPG